jgi:hypothetical protein
MKKNDEQLLIDLCDTYAGSGTLSLAECARRCGTTRVSLWTWMNDPTLIIPYMGQQVPFAKAMKMARRCAIAMTISGSLEDRVANGHWESVWFQGQPTWVEDERCVGLDEEMRIMLGYPVDGLLRDENGNRVQQRRHVPAPAQLIEKFVEANAPKLYGAKSKLEIDNRISLGVTSIPQRAAPLPTPVEVITQQITETVASEAIADGAESFEAEDAEPEYNEQPEAQGYNVPEPLPAPEPAPLEPVEGLTTEELELLRRAQSPSPLVADLAKRAAAKIAQGRSADFIGVGRTPGSGGRRTA